MKKLKQILAIIGIVVILGLYITTFVLALLGNKVSTGLFSASLYATFVVPVMLYIFFWVADLLRGKPHQ